MCGRGKVCSMARGERVIMVGMGLGRGGAGS